ncbi:4-hydroxy-tetrahydrodipicolinate synthase [Zeaxanthinibacter sp. PT1]|uniref:4-hydroxy-tetrahydrodipicolinate synthase n=1 Tax=Zeaxanthinibacter TaxID=561554 RepID=UPI00234B0FE5|nr:4-hydroxy-tetrahydrodipicolinate synthase [Zeaxanthinibacter sp. PT1]MDC6351744.1 4-hydroxy-tetrahydrodipicolinate synthase [Zeaxanthinibacter sp. PT1]
MEALYGTGVALITPFKADLSIDVEALRQVVDHCIEGGVDYLVVLGTTGESVTLAKSEKQLVIKTVIEQNSGRVPLVLGVGGNNTMQLVDELKSANLQSFDAVLSVSPYYNKPTQEGIYRHYKMLAEASPVPIILYNVPGRTGSNVLPETVLRLAALPNIVAIKEASGNMEQVNQIIGKKPADFKVISGDDITALETVLSGGVGVISVIGQGLPSEFSRMIRLGLEHSEDEAFAMHEAMKEGMELIFKEGNPAGIKAMMAAQGLCNPEVRLPLVPATRELTAQIAGFMKSFKTIQA